MKVMAMVLLTLAASLPMSVLAGAQTPVASGQERFSINVPLGKEYCALDPANAADKGLIQEYSQRYGQNAYLYRVAVECARRPDWRNPAGKVADATLHLVLWRNQLEQLPMVQRDGLSQQECKIAREQTGQPQAQPRAAFDKRLMQQLHGLKDNEARLVGAVEEDAKACHLLSVQKSHLKASNEPVTAVNVRSSTTINGRVLQLWHVTYARPGSEAAAIDKSLAHVKAVVAGLHGANP